MNKFKTTGNQKISDLSFLFNTSWSKGQQVSSELSNLEKGIPTMKNSEISFLQTYLLESENVFEFGCGSSTIFISNNENIKNIHSVDSNIDWINKIKENLPKKTKLHYVDINADPDNWGHPLDHSKIDDWPKYSSVLLKIRNFFPDLILVDGRFRVACALKSISRMKKDSYLMIHDYTLKFQRVENYFDIVDKAGSLYVFNKKNNINERALKKDIKRYQYICD